VCSGLGAVSEGRPHVGLVFVVVVVVVVIVVGFAIVLI
jgi:hypothetical protein